MNDCITVYIIDDNRLLREGLAFMLSEQEGFAVAGSAEKGLESLAEIVELRPDVTLVDIGIPGKGGLDVTKALREELPETRVLVLGMPDVTDEIMACIEAGAAGYVLKEASFDYLLDTIRQAHRGESFCSPRVAASLFSRVAELAGDRFPRSPIKLTPRELEIIGLVAEGMTNKEIAGRISVELQTVKNHVHNILDKLQLHSRLEAVQYARERNLLGRKSE